MLSIPRRDHTAPAPGSMQPLQSGSQLNKSGGLDARNLELLAAPHVLAHHLVVQQHHITGSLLEFGAVALVGVARQPFYFAPQQPAQIVRLRAPAKRAVQRRGLLRLRFFVKPSFVHECFRYYPIRRPEPMLLPNSRPEAARTRPRPICRCSTAARSAECCREARPCRG